MVKVGGGYEIHFVCGEGEWVTGGALTFLLAVNSALSLTSPRKSAAIHGRLLRADGSQHTAQGK